MKNYTLTLFFAIILAFTALTSCTKEGITGTVTAPVTPAPAAVGTGVYYVDSAKIYSTAFTGTDRKLVVGIDTLSPNSYIGSVVRSADGTKLYFLHYTSGSTPAIKLYGVNKDGTGLTMIKNMPAGGPEYLLIRATTDNKIAFFQATVTPPSTFVNSLQIINTDGTGQTTLATIPAGTALIKQLSLGLNRYAAYPGGVLQTGTIAGGIITAQPNLSSVIGTSGYSLSSDGTKIAYGKLNASNKIEIYVYDVATATSVLKFTHTPVAGPVISGTGATDQVSVRWVSGTEKILLGYGKFTSPSGSASDFTQFTLYTLSTSAEVTWRFDGDQITNVITE